MKLYDRLPDSVTVGRKRVKVDLDFRNVLRMLETLQRDDLMPDARKWLAVRCVCKHPVKGTLDAVKTLLFPEPPKKDAKRVTSFEQDAGLIRTAFRQVYGIDLFRAKLHWLEFIELLHNLPDGNRYAEIVSIRSRPLPAATKYNAKEREWLMKAKAQVALHLTEAEAARQYDKDVGNIFAGIMSMIPKEVKTDGK